MHASSLENMRRCLDSHMPEVAPNGVLTVVDVGGANVNGAYRDLFAGVAVRYVAVDLQAGPGVDIALDDPYRLPIPDGSADLVLSGQMLEHCEYFWLSFAEMIRILRPGGRLFLIAPSSGPIHRYPVDCYRFYPDAYNALAKLNGVALLDCWRDERGPWEDLVGVFEKPEMLARFPVLHQEAPPPFDQDSADMASAEEQVRGAATTHDVLSWLHDRLRPELYCEIGVREGRSLALAACTAIGVDPQPDIRATLPATARVEAVASDEFFRLRAAERLARGVDFGFVDGMHLFEFALRDFMNLERHSAPGAVIAIDDVLPNHVVQASRERKSRVWTGDVWKLVQCLREARPELHLELFDTSPAGLCLVTNLDPSNRKLWRDYNPIVRRFAALNDPPPGVLRRDGAAQPTAESIERFVQRAKGRA